MLAGICFFLPGMVLNWLRGKLIAPGRTLKQEAIEYAAAVLGLNYVMMLFLIITGRGIGGLGENIDRFMLFSFKYLTCTMLLAVAEPYWEKDMRSRIRSKGGIKKLLDFRELSAGAAVSAAASFLLCVFGPLEIYFHNQQEFWFDLYSLLPAVLLLFAAAALAGCVLSAVLYLIHPKAYKAGVALGFIFFACSYVQGNFLAGNLPPLDGTEVVWADYRSDTVVSLLLWCAAVFAAVLVIRRIRMQKFCRIAKLVSGGVTLVLALTIISVCFMTKGYAKKQDVIVTSKGEFEMSDDENVIILCMDSVDTETFDEVMRNNPEYKKAFDGFTYFADTMGAYSFTTRSIPFILSGEWYENEEPFSDYEKSVYENSQLFSDLEDKGYKLGIYESIVPPNAQENVDRFDNVLACGSQVTSYVDFARLEMQLAGFKYAPFGLKQFFMFDMNEFYSVRRILSEYWGFDWTTYAFNQNAQWTTVTYTDEKCFKFIHLEGAHHPFHYDKDVNYIEEDEGSYEQSVEACITAAGAYLQKLKTNGVYDNSAIVIMADHGYNWGEVSGRQDPVLMIKGMGESHKMQVSNAPVSYDDLQEAYRRLLDGKESAQAFDWKEGDKRERRYLWYEWAVDEHLVEYMQPGKASDTDAMYRTGREYNE